MVDAVIYGALRIKNEARWIDKVIRSIQPACAKVIVFDDHSDDGTPEICEGLGCVVYRSEFTGIDESRDKDFLLERIWNNGAALNDYVLMVDGDEMLHSADVSTVQNAALQGLPGYTLKIVYLWDREDQMRVDRIYSRFTRPSMFRLISRDLSFRRTAYGGNFHCSNVPAGILGRCSPLDARLLHFGYMHRADRIRKYHWYSQQDPGNAFEDGYRHIAQGDLPELPASASFRHAGPLELKSL